MSSEYDGTFELYKHLWQINGSVFPKSFCVALPVAFTNVALRYFFDRLVSIDDVPPPSFTGSQMWTGFNAALGLLIVFRTQQAYARWWEGGSLLQQVRGEWYNAVSSLIAFTSRETDKRREVVVFQHLIVRLMSMLYCSALRQVAELPDDTFEILNMEGIDDESMLYLKDCGHRCEVICHWIQRLIVDGMSSRILPIPPPVMTRVFQELSRGMVNVSNVTKLKEFPIPFPYVQMVNFFLILQWMLTPIVNVFIVDNRVWSATLSFVSVFAFWGINYIAQEIEMPFGADVNDLPIAEMQRKMNKSLMTLLQRRSQTPPQFQFGEDSRISMRKTALRHVARRKAGFSTATENFGSTLKGKSSVCGSSENGDRNSLECPEDEDVLKSFASYVGDGESDPDTEEGGPSPRHRSSYSADGTFVGDGDDVNDFYDQEEADAALEESRKASLRGHAVVHKSSERREQSLHHLEQVLTTKDTLLEMQLQTTAGEPDQGKDLISLHHEPDTGPCLASDPPLLDTNGTTLQKDTQAMATPTSPAFLPVSTRTMTWSSAKDEAKHEYEEPATRLGSANTSYQKL